MTQNNNSMMNREERLRRIVNTLEGKYARRLAEYVETPWWHLLTRIWLFFELSNIKSEIRYTQTQLTLEMVQFKQ